MSGKEAFLTALKNLASEKSWVIPQALDIYIEESRKLFPEFVEVVNCEDHEINNEKIDDFLNKLQMLWFGHGCVVDKYDYIIEKQLRDIFYETN